MKHLLITASILATAAIGASAQSSIEMLQLTQPDFRGTARFMGMGGAFTALGGDLSTMTQNPAGLGIYRHSEIGATLDINIQNTKAPNGSNGWNKNDKTQAACNNFGYIGVANLGTNSAMQTFAWGVTYNRVQQFDRRYRAYAPSTQTSLTNYIASFSNGIPADKLNFGEDYNPYRDSNNDWLSILAFNSYLITPQQGTTDTYNGLYQPGVTTGDAGIDVRERGWMDEYNISFGGNVSNVVYWGLGVGITDLSYRRDVSYSESMANASVNNFWGNQTATVDGNAGYYLDNAKKITGSGFKLDFGVIVKPINELRIGAAIHTPTWWKLDEDYQAYTDYSFFNNSMAEGTDNPRADSEYSDWAAFSWKLKAPWRFMVGAAAVLGQNAIISIDYERQAFNDMTLKNAEYDNYGYIYDYVSNDNVNNNVKKYCKAANIIRVGAEYRVTPKFSIRAGYNHTSSNISDSAMDGNIEIATSGTDPSYRFDKSTQNITFGLGYRFGAFYVDGTYVHTTRKSDLHAYTNSTAGTAPSWEVTDNNNQLVFSLGFRF